MENTRSHYASYKELGGAIEAGWLPGYFPRSAIDIQEGHNIDTNRVWASFKYEVSDIPSLREVCKVLAENESGLKLLCPPFDKRTSTFVLKKNGTGHYLSYENGI